MSITQVIRSFNHTRRFGLELEFFGISRARVKEVLREAAIPVWAYGDYGDGRECWRVTSDGSIDARSGDSVELVSPILSGREGLAQVADVVKLMLEAGAKVNKSCGFHVHVDAAGLSGATFMNIVKRYARFETQIDSFMVHSRRATNNNYCRDVASLVGRFTTTVPTSTADDVARLASRELYDETSGRYVGGRYHKVNLTAFLRHGTIEFRHHSGTMNATKVVNWIAFCLNFVAESIASDEADLFTGMDPVTVAFFNERSTALTTPPVVRPYRNRR